MSTNFKTLVERPFGTVRGHINRIEFLTMLGMLPPLGVTLYSGGTALLSVLALSLFVAVFWQIVFLLTRKHRLSWSSVSVAVLFTIIAGTGAFLWQIALAMTFGVVVAEQIFGGRGFNFLSPAVAALVFMTFSFTGFSFADPAPGLMFSVLPAAIVLIAARIISWRIVAGLIVGLVATGLVFSQNFQPNIFLGSFLLITVFLACDPVGATSTNLGRWIYGFLVGGLCWVFAVGGNSPGESAAFIPAVFLASIFAPLIDTLVVHLNHYVRRSLDG